MASRFKHVLHSGA